MRKIGEFQEQKGALRFWNYLKAQGIDSSLEEEEDEANWTIWVADEDNIKRASLDFKEFNERPEDPKFTTENPENKVQEEEGAEESKISNKGFIEHNLSERWRKRERRQGVMTMSLIITSVGVYLVSAMGTNEAILSAFFISKNPQGLDEVFSGQFWRLFTPIFIHLPFYGIPFLHLAFNMYWLHALGSQIERLKGSKFFITFVLTLALFSNLAEFLMSGPLFGGMSGVVYGLFGYVFIKCKMVPGDGFYIDPFVANILFAWFALCFISGGIANWAHAGGLLVGLAWGYGSALRWNRGKR